MKTRYAIRASLLALALLAGPGAAAGYAQNSVRVVGVLPDPTFGRISPEVPSGVAEAASQAYNRHGEVWGRVPIDTTLDGRPVVFWFPNDDAGAWAGNYFPYKARLEYPLEAIICTNMPGAANWCAEDRYSVGMKSRTLIDTPWAMPILFSHEYVHLWQRRWWSNPVADDYPPHWLYEGTANGWGYGLMETDPQFTREAIARQLANSGALNYFAFFLGLRYYDQPLDVDSAVNYYPGNHPAYPRDNQAFRFYQGYGVNRCRDAGLRERPGCRDDLRQEPWVDAAARDRLDQISTIWAHRHIAFAGYMSGSFYRYMLLGNRRGPDAVRRMMRSPGPRTTRLRAWMTWMDLGIQLETVPVPAGTGGQNASRDVPVWPGGVRQIYSEMIAELADFPDTHVQSRSGFLAQRSYDSLLWSRGCTQIDLTTDPAQSFTEIRLEPVSARCTRVRAARGSAVYRGGSARVPTTFVVTASSRPGSDPDVCEDLQLASRGQVLRNPLLSVTGVGEERRCSISWTVVFDPLRPNDANGNGGYQTVLLINANEFASLSRRRYVDIEFVQPQMRASVNAEGVPEAERPRPRPRRRPLPRPQPVEPQQSHLPQRFATAPDPDPGPCPPEERRAFACGPVMTVQLATGDVAVLSGAGSNMMSAFTMFDLRPGAMDRDMGEVASDAIPDQIEQFAAAMARYQQTGAAPEGLNVAIGFEPIEFGTTGTFPARVQVNWSDGTPMGIGALDSLGPYGGERYPNGCIGGTPPSQATVTITRHSPGMLVGSVSARLFEENEGDDACTRPYVEAGTFQASFATNGHFPPLRGENGGSVEINNVWLERYALEDLSRLGQMMPGVQLASGTSGGGTPVLGGDTQTGALRDCPQPGDIEAFIESLIAQLVAAGGNPADMDQVREIYRGMPAEDLAESACDWIEQGRP